MHFHLVPKHVLPSTRRIFQQSSCVSNPSDVGLKPPCKFIADQLVALNVSSERPRRGADNASTCVMDLVRDLDPYRLLVVEAPRGSTDEAHAWPQAIIASSLLIIKLESDDW